MSPWRRRGGLAHRPARAGTDLRTRRRPPGDGAVRHRPPRPAALRARRRGAVPVEAASVATHRDRRSHPRTGARLRPAHGFSRRVVRRQPVPARGPTPFRIRPSAPAARHDVVRVDVRRAGPTALRSRLAATRVRLRLAPSSKIVPARAASVATAAIAARNGSIELSARCTSPSTAEGSTVRDHAGPAFRSCPNAPRRWRPALRRGPGCGAVRAVDRRVGTGRPRCAPVASNCDNARPLVLPRNSRRSSCSRRSRGTALASRSAAQPQSLAMLTCTC